MPLTKSQGNMYNNVVTWNPLGGRCEHICEYCYVHKGRMKSLKKYQGEPFLVVKELNTNLYKCKDLKPPFTVFVASCNDLFAKSVPKRMIENILWVCKQFPDNTYLFQSKNPWRFLEYLSKFPPNTILGTTIESNKQELIFSSAPPMEERYEAMVKLRKMTKC